MTKSISKNPRQHLVWPNVMIETYCHTLDKLEILDFGQDV